MFSNARICKHETGLWFRHQEFQGVLGPGRHRHFVPFFAQDRVEVVDRLAGRFEHARLSLLVRESALAELLTLVDLKDDERALVWRDGRLGWVLGPGLHAFWNEPAAITVETFNVNDFVFDHPKIETVLAFRGASNFLDGIRVDAHERVLLYRQGELVRDLGPGLFAYWKQSGRIGWKSVDLREQVLDVAGQEIMTRDKVTLRINLVLVYGVADARRSVESSPDAGQALYRDAQLALREAVGTRTLDTLLSDKDAVSAEVRDALATRADPLGLAVRGVGLRDVILPGDMKAILNEVILAEKQAQAQLIRRREETAAARSQANTAKLLADNPVLTRMKELEALQEILKGTKATFLFGRGDLAEQVRSLAASG